MEKNDGPSWCIRAAYFLLIGYMYYCDTEKDHLTSVTRIIGEYYDRNRWILILLEFFLVSLILLRTDNRLIQQKVCIICIFVMAQFFSVDE
jgi:hypothetical protein